MHILLALSSPIEVLWKRRHKVVVKYPAKEKSPRDEALHFLETLLKLFAAEHFSLISPEEEGGQERGEGGMEDW
jgi:hypothetical protein